MATLVLIIDDEPNIIGTVAPLFRRRGYDVMSAMTGRAGLERFERDKPALIVLDLGLPDMDGVEVCRQVRETSQVPIVVLSARDSEADKVSALDAGADDYVTKPFGAEELLARIRATLRRVAPPSSQNEPIVCGGLVIDRERFRVLRDGEEVRLTPREFELLTFLAQHSGRVLTHRALFRAVWGPHAVDQPEHLRVLIGSLRKKIEPNPSAPRTSSQNRGSDTDLRTAANQRTSSTLETSVTADAAAPTSPAQAEREPRGVTVCRHRLIGE